MAANHAEGDVDRLGERPDALSIGVAETAKALEALDREKSDLQRQKFNSVIGHIRSNADSHLSELQVWIGIEPAHNVLEAPIDQPAAPA